MKSGSDNLLETAMASLQADASKDISKEKRDKIFALNQHAIENIKKANSSVAIGNLQIKPNVNGEVDSQLAQPLAHSQSFEIDLSKLSLPSECGSGTLKDAIQRLCRENNIQVDEKTDVGTFTSVVTAIAGQHAENDTNCSSVTKAEFAPVFTSNNSVKRVLALCYSLNGETKLRVDHLRVQGSMPCLGRKSNSSTALQAIEIPNLIAAEMKDEQPELFDQLKKSACLVTFVEYDLIQPQTNYSGPVYRGGGTKSMFGDHSSTTRGFTAQGISAYSVIGQGSHAQDHSSTVTESGTRKITKIHVYLVGAMVINTNEQVLTPVQCANITKLMQARAHELNNFYLPSRTYKAYNYDNLNIDLNNYLQKYKISITTDIFEHALLRLGSINENPTACKFGRSEHTPQYFFVDLGISHPTVIIFVNNLRKVFGDEICQYTPQHNRNSLHAIRFSLEIIAKNFSAIEHSIDEILLNHRNLIAYQRYTHHQESLYNTIVKNFEKIVTPLEISLSKTDCAEIVFLKMFGCEEELHKARFQSGNDYVGKMLDTHFYFDISEKAAKQLVDTINQKFSTYYIPARLISVKARLAEKGHVDLSEIAIDNDLLCDEQFLSLFKETFNNISENEPFLIEKLRFQSGTQVKSSNEYAYQLSTMAQHYQYAEVAIEPGENNPKQKLAEALCTFSSIITAPKGKRSERLIASDTVRRAVAFFESTQTPIENEEFKKADKKTIKEAQRSLGLRK